ncbi:hypothetical protein CCR75_001242 [Bremia lactucae]|uniref:U2 snRNP-associated SURP motif-containing protein n=1 Tax=Bremia lactucae TaxID=4779 RepID=A0A976NY56_BRELC|nr:hypothetical protein CCR75_001242 [Bremia lactucae]
MTPTDVSRVEEDGAPTAAAQSNLPWGMETTEMQPSSLTKLTDDKLARFVLGHQQKTKFQKDREDREAKKRQADEEAAKIYTTFVASFDNEEETKGKTFVRGGTDATPNMHESSRQSGDVYRLRRPDQAASGAFAPSKKVSEMDKMLQEIKQKDAEQKDQVQVLHQPKKRRAIDDFLEEMKERGPAPVSMDTIALTKGSFDTGDPETTNLYVGNLAPTVTEEVLKAEFGRYGEVYSIKIMWPRSEEERARKRNCGFVSFYKRRDADDARINLDDKQLEGQPMIVGWGKAVKIPSRAISSMTSNMSSLPAMPTSILPSLRANPAGKDAIVVEIPNDSEVRRLVDRLAEYVATDGLQFENAVRIHEGHNQLYRFLLEPQSAVGLYYRWRVYSFAMGDDAFSWRESPFQMTLEGPIWQPPKMPSRVSRSYRQDSPLRLLKRSGRLDRSPSSSPRPTHRRNRSYHRSRSKSPSLKKSSRRSGSRHRSRSCSVSSRDDSSSRRSRRRTPSRRRRSRSRQSRSWSSDDSSSRKRGRHTRSHPIKYDQRLGDNRREGTRADVRIGDRQRNADEGDKLLTGQQIARARDMERGRERNRLPRDDYDKFKTLLKELTLERESIKMTMGFALDKSEAAVDLVNIVFESFKESSSSGLALISLLYVTSDILHNSSAAVKNASLFRTTFQERLPEIMDILRVAHKNIAGRMSANAMKEKVTNVLTAWENWSLFPPAVLVGLHATFLRKLEENEYIVMHDLNFTGIGESDLERLRKTCRQAGIVATGDAKSLVARLQWLKEFTSPTAQIASGPVLATNSSLPYASTNKIVPQAVSETHSKRAEVNDFQEKRTIKGSLVDEDLDGEPVDEKNSMEESNALDEELGGEAIDGDLLKRNDSLKNDFNGELLDGEDLDGVPMDEKDLDGVPMDGENLDGEDLDGVPMDEEDLDGAPLDGEPI